MYPKTEWPPQTMMYEFKIDNDNPDLEPSLTKLAEETVQYLGSLGMPNSVTVDFEPRPQRHLVPTAKSHELEIAIHHIGDGESAMYSVKSIVEEHSYVDEARYLLWRPQRTGFMLPWGISVESLTRIVHPAKRHRRFNLDDPKFTAKSPLQSTSGVLNAIRRGAYKLHHPVIRQINGQEQ